MGEGGGNGRTPSWVKRGGKEGRRRGRGGFGGRTVCSVANLAQVVGKSKLSSRNSPKTFPSRTTENRSKTTTTTTHYLSSPPLPEYAFLPLLSFFARFFSFLNFFFKLSFFTLSFFAAPSSPPSSERSDIGPSLM